MAVTRRQKEVLDFILNFEQRNGYSVSFEEIARGLGLRSLATVHKHVTNLENKGLLLRAHNRSRSIDVIPARSKTEFTIPLMGTIAAGLPLEAAENAEGVSFSDIVGTGAIFGLRVRGDSMRDEHILDGDYVLVEKSPTAPEGAIVVALVNGVETTLKRYYKEGPMIRLQPSNAEMDPIFVPAAQVSIQGLVKGLLRRYR